MTNSLFDIPAEYVGERNVSRETIEKLRLYHALLLKWQKTINLVSPSTLKEAWHRHFLDSVQIVRLLQNTDGKILVDMGSGAGFPGLVIAILCPELNVHVIESDNRKSQFMKNVIRETGIKNAVVHIERIENVKDLKADFVTARAFAPLNELLGHADLFAQSGTQYLFLKGSAWQAEYATLCDDDKNRTFDAVPGLTADNAVILCFS